MTPTLTTPVDLHYRAARILIRRIPGSADLERRRCAPVGSPAATHVLPDPDALDEADITIIKARAANPSHTGHGSDRVVRARFDLTLSTHPHVVFLGVCGDWLAAEREAHIADLAGQLASRLRRFAWSARHDCRPSLCYETMEAPERVQLEVTTFCNLRCGYCANPLLPQKQHTSLASIKAMLDRIDLTHVWRIDLTGLGEALMHPQLPAIVAEVRRRGAIREVGLVSNGSLATVQRCKPLIDAGLTSIAISVDTLDPVRSAQARPGGRLDVILANVSALAAFRRTLARPFDLNLKSVLQDESWDDVEAILEFSARHQLDCPVISTLDRRESTVQRYPADVPRDTPLPTWRTVAARVDERWAQLTGTTATAPRAPIDHLPWVNPALRLDLATCVWVTDSAYVGHDGHCIACCEQMGDLPRASLGSVYDKPLRSLWNDEFLYGFRLPLAMGLTPASCRGCDFLPEHISRP